MKSLLNKSLSQFLFCTVIVFLLSVPVFYLLTKHYYAEDIVDIIEAVEQGNAIPPLDLEEDIMIGMTMQFVLIFAMLCFSLLITLRFITRRLWLPFNDTLRKTEQFNLAQGDIPQFQADRNQGVCPHEPFFGEVDGKGQGYLSHPKGIYRERIS